MKTAQQSYEDTLIALREKTFKRLMIRRIHSRCYLIITIDEDGHVFCDRGGAIKEYRHAWQIREWLRDTFGIQPESVPLEPMP